MSSSDNNNSPPLPSPNATDRRRSSFSAQSFADLFARQPNTNSNGSGGQIGSYPGPITSAAAQAQRRRLSLTTLGLSGNPNQGSPFNNSRTRTESFSSNSTTSGTVDESPFEEDDRSAPPSSANQPTFARRLSFGARALRDRQSNGSAGNANGRPSADKTAFQSPTAKGRGEGFNFAESMRSRAERGSISGQGMPQSPPSVHERSKSIATMEPPKEMPRPTQKAPDAFQERILKGDFYMD